MIAMGTTQEEQEVIVTTTIVTETDLLIITTIKSFEWTGPELATEVRMVFTETILVDRSTTKDERCTYQRGATKVASLIATALAIVTLATGCSGETTDSNRAWDVEDHRLVIRASGTLYRSWDEGFEWEEEDTHYQTTYLIGEQLSGVSDEVFRSHSSDHIVIQAESAFRIGNQCFQGTTARCIDLSQTAVETLGHHCFANTTNLEEIHLPNTVRMIDVGAFDSTTATIYFYGTREEWDAVEIKATNDILNLIDVVCVEDDMVFDDYGNGWWRINEDTLQLVAHGAYVGGSAARNYPWHCSTSNVKRIIVSGSIIYLSPYAFAQKDLQAVTIFSSTFVDCGIGLFAGSSIERVDLANTSLTELSMDFFYQAQIREVFLPDTLKRIGPCCFQESEIDTIFFAGTYDQWQSIVIEKSNDSLNYTRVVCLADGLVIE